MAVSISSQVAIFFWCIFCGLIIGLLFDVFRLSRKIIPTNDYITYIEDIIFWLLVGVVVLATVFQCNQGQLRGFVFLGIFLGAIFYFMLFSNLMMRFIIMLFKLSQKIINYVIKYLEKPIRVIVKVIIVPNKFIWKITKKLYSKIKSIYINVISNIKRSKKIIKEKV
ncbi:MAG: spore cortex biosynthesis protein YabQ [Deltaproteobacteria bacterium]